MAAALQLTPPLLPAAPRPCLLIVPRLITIFGIPFATLGHSESSVLWWPRSYSMVQRPSRTEIFFTLYFHVTAAPAAVGAAPAERQGGLQTLSPVYQSWLSTAWSEMPAFWMVEPEVALPVLQVLVPASQRRMLT